MSVRLIIGRAGCGKTRYCFDKIVDALRADPLGETIYWIVPKQETFTAERELTCASGLPGFCRARVVSFELLGEEILEECGGTAIPRVTRLGRQMMIGHLLRQHEADLKYYRSTARRVGLAKQLDETFSELERCGKSAADLSDLITDLQTSGADNESLLNKMHDLRFLYDRYVAFLGQERLDPHRRLTEVLASVGNCNRIKKTTVYVDGFLEFTEYERRVLAGLAQTCAAMHITMLIDPASKVARSEDVFPDEMGLFFKTEDAIRRVRVALREAGVAVEVEALKNISRFKSDSLAVIERSVFTPRFKPAKNSDGVELLETPDRRTEVDAIARHIRTLTKIGFRYRDIVVIMRDLDDYQDLIQASFSEHRIPIFIDRRRPAAHHPLIALVRSALAIAAHGWPHDAAMSLLKTELTPITREQADELENYVLHHRIRGMVWADENDWTFRRTTHREDEPADAHRPELAQVQAIDALRRRVATPLIPLTKSLAAGQPILLKQIVIALHDTLAALGVWESMQTWMKQAEENSRIGDRDEHQQVWQTLIELLDQMVDVLGDASLTANEFIEILETGLEGFDFALTPARLDQVVVGTVERTRAPRARAVIVMGMNDGQFPSRFSGGSILTDSERRSLRERKIDLDPDGERQTFDERLLGYIAFTRASERLLLSRSLSDSAGRPQSASPFWMMLRELFPTLSPREIARDSCSPAECIGTPRQLATALMRWVRHDNSRDADSPWPALYQWFASQDDEQSPVAAMKQYAWPALSYENFAALEPATCAQLFNSPLETSVSRLETFATCPFKHFATYGLKLREREDENVTAIDIGTACHDILENVIRQMLGHKAGWAAHSTEVTGPLITQLAHEVGQDLRGELMLSSARNQFVLERIEKTINDVMAAQSTAGMRGRMLPWKTELRFGNGGELPPLALKTPNGNRLALHGRIDRVDLVADEAAFAVIDYKLNKNLLSLQRVHHGLSLQLLTYLLVLQRSGEQLAGEKITPVAAFYVQVLRQLESVKHPSESIEPADEQFHLRFKPRGIIDCAHRELFETGEWSHSQVVNIRMKADGTLGYRATTDACDGDEFFAMLRLAERKVVELADQILSGEITVFPYRLGQVTPCPTCDFKSVCRFDPAVNQYRKLDSIGREEAIAMAVEQIDAE